MIDNGTEPYTEIAWLEPGRLALSTLARKLLRSAGVVVAAVTWLGVTAAAHAAEPDAPATLVPATIARP